jgi:hypothetical protein
VKIFVSYRREDTEPVVARLCTRLDQAYGERNVFFDKRSIATGSDYLGTVGGVIYTSDVILVVIGPLWTTTRNADGQLRLEDEDDPVGWEVGLGLASRKTLIPLLVDNVRMPAKRDLPARLQNITTLSGLPLDSGPGFEACVDTLVRRLGGPDPQAAAPPRGSRAPRASAAWTTFEGHWQDRNGGWSEIVQEGNRVELHATDPMGVTYVGQGEIQNGFAVLNFATSLGIQGQAVLQLIEGGAYIAGQAQTPFGVTPIHMMRRR